MMLRYLIGAVFVFVIMVVQFCFSWLIALFLKSDGHYPTLLKVFEPYDTLAIGDHMYLDNEMSYTKNWTVWFRNYWLALNWGMRNCGYGAMGYAGFKTGHVTKYMQTGDNVDIGDFGYVLGTSEIMAVNDNKTYFNYKRAEGYQVSRRW